MMDGIRIIEADWLPGGSAYLFSQPVFVPQVQPIEPAELLQRARLYGTYTVSVHPHMVMSIDCVGPEPTKRRPWHWKYRGPRRRSRRRVHT